MKHQLSHRAEYALVLAAVLVVFLFTAFVAGVRTPAELYAFVRPMICSLDAGCP